MAGPINPTQLTPPRVAFIDDRTGAISREWYRFFLSLLTAVQTNQTETELAPNANSLLASFEEALDNVSYEAFTQPRAELGTMAALQQADLPWFTFNVAPSPVPTAVGSVYWDGGTTAGIQMTANVLGRVNEDLFYYIKASSAITKGQVIMFTGAVGSSGVPTGAPATGVTDGSYIMGVAAENIALNGFGLVQFNGTLKGINTSAFADGDILWYNPAVTGGFTKTIPTAPNVKVQMAAVINAGSGGSGSILIRVNSGSVLGGTDSNVQISGLANNDMLVYVGANSRWENKAPAATRTALGLGSGTPSNGQLLIGNGTNFTTAGLTAGDGIAITNGAGSVTVATSLAAGANISITGTSTKTIAVTGLGTMALENIGVSGTFTTADTPPKTVTVTNGIITNIV